MKVEGKIVVSKNEIKRLIRSDHRNNPRNLLNVIFMNYITACSFLSDTDVEEKRKDISLARQQISFIVYIIGSNSLGDLGSVTLWRPWKLCTQSRGIYNFHNRQFSRSFTHHTGTLHYKAFQQNVNKPSLRSYCQCYKLIST